MTDIAGLERLIGPEVKHLGAPRLRGALGSARRPDNPRLTHAPTLADLRGCDHNFGVSPGSMVTAAKITPTGR